MELLWKLRCLIFGHMWVEWDHSIGMPRHLFKKGTMILKRPYCNFCLVKRPKH